MPERAPSDPVALTVAGPDRARFLQGQLTQDVAAVVPDRAPLGAFLTPQGRVIALPRLLARDETLVLLLPDELAAPLEAHLRRYLLRAKVTLALPGDALAVRVIAEGGAPPSATATHRRRADGVSEVTLPGRTLLVGPAALLPPPPDTDERAQLELAAIRAGEPTVTAATREAFIPQMLNLDLLQGVSFSKGCYTGQEIVARTQHLGRIKRRMFRYAAQGAAAPPPAGSTLVDAHGRTAEVVRSAATADGVELLAVFALEARLEPLVAPDGTRLLPVALPYAVE
jgi:hypothetical protein